MKHAHVEKEICNHEFVYCKKCDAVECSKCEDEWVKPCTQSHWNYQYYPNYTNYPTWSTGTIDLNGGVAM